MGYEVHNSSIYGKILYKDGRPVIVNYDDAEKLLQRFNGTSVWKLPTGRYLIKLPETITSLEECDCEIVGQEQPYAMGSQYSEEPRDNEVHMARADLYRTAKLAIMLHEMLKNVSEERGLDGWVQRKLTRAADYIESVFDYMDYEMRYPEEEMMEDPQVPGQLQPPQGQQQPTPQPNTQSQNNTNKPDAGKNQTPGMIKMAKLDTNGKVQGLPVMVPATQVKSKQLAGFHVIGESASAGASSAGGMAVGAMGGVGSSSVGSLFGGTYNQKKRKKKRTEGTMSDAEKESTGPKFTGYWKGTDKGPPGKKMVGGGA